MPRYGREADTQAAATPTDMEMDDDNKTNGTDVPAAPSVPPISPIGGSFNLLDQIKQNFHPEGMLRHSRSKSTFSTTQRENEKLIFYLWIHNSAMLHDAFDHHLHDVDATIDYTHITNPIKRYRGAKSEQERERECREKVIRSEISEALGPGGTKPTTPTINFDAFTADAKIYIGYIQQKIKDDGQMMKPGVYGGYHTSLNNLFRRYRYHPSEDYDTDMKQYMDGTKHLANLATQVGEVRKLEIKIHY